MILLKKIPILLLLFISLLTTAQTRKQLENQRKKTKKQIENLNKLLFENKNKKKNTLEDLDDINQRIAVRQKLITTIFKENKILSQEITTNQNTLKNLNEQLRLLKEDYAAMIFKSYKSKSQQNRAMFLLSSKNFYQAYKRLQYMKQYTSFRKKQGNQISLQTKKIARLNDSLITQKKIKDTLLLVEKEQKQKIEVDKKRQERIIATIKKKEKKYKKELQKKIREEKRITTKIDNLIKAAIARSNKNIKKKSTKKATGFILTPEAKALANNFEKNKGKLPWPVTKGFITRKFGVQKHPTISGITINSTGIHIATEKGSYAKSIFNGTVFEILKQAEGKKSVMIKHGNYISAYNNLETVLVKKGDKITTKQQLGKIFTDKITRKTTLVFVLFKNTQKLNPSHWILKP